MNSSSNNEIFRKLQTIRGLHEIASFTITVLRLRIALTRDPATGGGMETGGVFGLVTADWFPHKKATSPSSRPAFCLLP